MKTINLTWVLVLAVSSVAAQNFPVRNLSKISDEKESVINYSAEDASMIQSALKNILADTSLIKLTDARFADAFNDLYRKSYSKGTRGITNILKRDISKSKNDFDAALNNEQGIEPSKKIFRQNVDTAYKKAIDKYSRMYEIHAKRGPLWFPGRNRFLTRYYFTNEKDRTVEALSSGSFSFNTAYQGGSLFTELIAGYLTCFRISFGGMIAKSEIDNLTAEEIENLTEEELTQALQALKEENDKKLTAQNIIAGGGNALLNLATPLMHYSNSRNDFISVVSAFGRLGLALPEIGTTSDDAEVNSQYGLQFDLWHDLLTTSEERSFALFGKAMVSVFHNDTYSTNLGIHNGFRYIELSAGIEFNTRFRIAMNFPFIYGDNRPSEDNIDAIGNVNSDLLKSSVSVTIIPFK